MNILNLEDSPFKHFNIRRALQNASLPDFQIENVTNLEDGVDKIKGSLEAHAPYDLIITDMYFPGHSGGKEEASGAKLIEIAKTNGWSIPIIICSSACYAFPGILGCVHYSEEEDWESKLLEMVRKIANRTKSELE